jgi:hypothetical protein
VREKAQLYIEVRKYNYHMGFFALLRRLLHRSKPIEALEKNIQAQQALKITPEALERALENRLAKSSEEEFREHFQLGLAAGYTGRSIKEIESSLSRIESQMVTKDWFLSNFEDKTPHLIELLRSHEEEEKKRFELLNNILASLQKSIEKTPQSTEVLSFTQVTQPPKQLPLTSKMEGLILTVKEFGEISYQDLALKLGISVSGLRGLLTNTLRRTNKIERFIRDGKGWVRYKGD